MDLESPSYTYAIGVGLIPLEYFLKFFEVITMDLESPIQI